MIAAGRPLAGTVDMNKNFDRMISEERVSLAVERRGVAALLKKAFNADNDDDTKDALRAIDDMGVKDIAKAMMEEVDAVDCPQCYYCGNHKTWETTKYLRSYTFANKGACMDCYITSDNGYEWPYMAIRANGKPVFRDNLNDVLELWPYLKNPTLIIKGKKVHLRRSARLAAKEIFSPRKDSARE